MRFLLPSAVVSALLATSVAEAQVVDRPPVTLALDACTGADATEVRRILALELRAQPVPEDGAEPSATHVIVACEGPQLTLRVEDPLTGKSLTRVVDLSSAAPEMRTRLLAMAAAELVAASWIELVVQPAPTVPPASPVAPEEVRAEARESLRARSAATERVPRVEASPVVPPSTPPTPGLVFPSLDGSIGLLHTSTAEIPGHQSLRIGAIGSLDGGSSAFHSWGLGGSVGYSPIRYLDLFTSFRALTSDVGTRFDARLGAKLIVPVTPWLNLGASAAVIPWSGDSQASFAANATFQFLASVDLHRLTGVLPLWFHLDVGYTLDNSASTVAALEQSRRAATPGYDAATCARPATTDQFDPWTLNPACQVEITQAERYGWNINRTDRLFLTLALEGRFAWMPWLRPFAEWYVTAPSNRQGYVCVDAAAAAGGDRCLADQNLVVPPGAMPGATLSTFGAMPSALTLGLRGIVPSTGLAATLAVDVATGGAQQFVREVAPITPWTAYALVAYSFGGGGR